MLHHPPNTDESLITCVSWAVWKLPLPNAFHFRFSYRLCSVNQIDQGKERAHWGSNTEELGGVSDLACGLAPKEKGVGQTFCRPLMSIPVPKFNLDFCCCFYCFFETISLCSLECPGTWYVNLAGLLLTEILCLSFLNTKIKGLCLYALALTWHVLSVLLWLNEAQASESFLSLPCWFLSDINLWTLWLHTVPSSPVSQLGAVFILTFGSIVQTPQRQEKENTLPPDNSHFMGESKTPKGRYDMWNVYTLFLPCFLGHKHTPEWKRYAWAMMWLRVPRQLQDWGWSPKRLSSPLLTSKTGEGTTVQALKLLVSLGPNLKPTNSSASAPKLPPTVISFE